MICSSPASFYSGTRLRIASVVIVIIEREAATTAPADALDVKDLLHRLSANGDRDEVIACADNRRSAATTTATATEHRHQAATATSANGL